MSDINDEKPKLPGLKINLKKYRNLNTGNINLVNNLPENVNEYEIKQIEPPAGNDPEQLIYS